MAGRTLYLIDTYAQIFRSFFAIRTDMRSAVTGEPTQALFAMTGFLLKLLGKFQPDFVVAVVDAPGPTFRDALHEAYKGTRAETPADLKAQIPRILGLIDAMGIQRIEQSGLEADDIIAVITRQVLADPAYADVQIRIASKDKDLLQLLGERVTLFDIQTELETDVAALWESKGIEPGQVIDYLTLIGDTVDNVPGVPGVGPKTAAQLLQTYGTLEGIYGHLDALPARLREKMETAREQTVRSRVLVTLKDDDDLGFRLDDARPRGIDLAGTLELFRQFGFHRFSEEVSRLPLRDAETYRLDSADYDPFAEPGEGDGEGSGGVAAILPAIVRLAATDEAVRALCDEIRRDLSRKPGADPVATLPVLAVALECGEDGMPSALAFAWGEPERGGVCVPLDDLPEPEAAFRWKCIGVLLEEDTIPKIVHDTKMLTRALLRFGASEGITAHGIVFDVRVAAQLDGRPSAELAALAESLLPCGLPTFAGPCHERAVEHAVAILRCAPHLRTCLGAKDMGALFDEIEGPLATILARMEHLGICCDADELKRQGELLTARVAELKASVHAAAGFVFDLNSPQQLGVALFERLQLPAGKRTKTGYSTDKEVLETLAEDEDAALPHTAVPRLILEYRQLTKLLSTYLGNLVDAIHPATGRIHTTYRQLATATGRLASDGPNLQNIPVRSEVGRQIRRAFHAPAGGVLIAADYSQIELRLLAHLSGDSAMIDAFQQGIDIHTSVAMQVFGVDSPEAVTRDQRGQAKTINFGIVYGISPFGLARRIKALDRAQATELIAQYRARYEGIDRFLQECIDRAKNDGFVTTIAGRRRPIPEIRSRSTMALGERLAINTVVQGSAADLIKRAMVLVQHRIDRESLPARMLLQIHDELVFECPTVAEAARDVAEAIRAEMEAAMTLRVPLVAAYGIGENWRDAK